MPVWVEVFIVIAALALLVQTAFLVALLFEIRPLIKQCVRIASNLHAKMDPILLRTSHILDNSEDRIKSIMEDASEITHVARNQAQKVDRVFTDAVERLRLQVIRADHIVTGTLEVIEDAGSKVRRTVWRPIHQVSAVLKGLKVGLDVIRGERPGHTESDGAHQDEELFI
ncbi:MAG: DUF948 domain-containing protein [Candidatus Acidiferrales bacterium]